jgi:hypothetical protein
MATTTLDAAGMHALIDEHGRCELAEDWAGALATMTARPVYFFFPYRLRVAGAMAITAAWERMLSLPCFDYAKMDLSTAHQDIYRSDDSVLLVNSLTFPDEHGVRCPSTTIVRFMFAGDRIASESVFLDAASTRYTDAAFDASFRALAGVETI